MIILNGTIVDTWEDFNAITDIVYVYQIKTWGNIIQFEIPYEKEGWKKGDRVSIKINKI